MRKFPKPVALGGFFLAMLSLLTVPLVGTPNRSSKTNQSSSLQSIKIIPSEIFLGSQRNQQRLVVQDYYADGYSEDLTSKAQISSAHPAIVRVEGPLAIPVASGVTDIKAEVAGLRAEVKPVAKDIEKDAASSFRNHVIPVLTKSGCNMGACHGAAAGKNGFKLTLRGYDPEVDYLVLTREAVGRRICLQEPGRSRVLLKPTFLIPHAGGRRFGTNSLEYRVISQWIAEGSRPPSSEDRRIERISVEPSVAKLRPETRQQLVVTAHFSDGYVEDVTHWVRFESTNATTATVDDRGLVDLKGSGEASVTAMYLSKVAAATLTVPFANQIPRDAFGRSQQNNFIDKLVLDKLETLNIGPSEMCTDSEFLRRAYLDTTGTVPPVSEVREFLMSQAPDKRQKLVEELLKSEA